MLKTRIIPCLLLREASLVKTVKFDKYSYIGDPVNTARIFNELEVDELILVDILASRTQKGPDFKILAELANECFMPLAYGGGVRTLEDFKRILHIGLEKVAINTFAHEDPDFLSRAADRFGSQSVIGSIDIRKSFWGKYEVYINDGQKNTKLSPVEWAVKLQEKGAGELLITSMDKEGTWNGFDVELVKLITDAVSIPVIANGGAGNVSHIGEVVKKGGASAVALGSMVVFQGKDLGVLVNFPDKKELEQVLY